MDIDYKPTPHTEAAAIIRGKPAVARDVFDQILPELRARLFTVSGIESANVLQRVQDSIATIAEGTTWDDAKENIVAELDPWLGDGAERRAELLLRTHGFQAFQASNWRVAQEDEDTVALQYLTMEDDRVRPGHAALDGRIFPKNDSFWKTHFPPWEWGCRCRTRTMNVDQVADEAAADKDRKPEQKLVMTGAKLEKAREGTIVNQSGHAVSILPPHDEGAFAWHPDNLRIPLKELEQHYDPEVWAAFVEWAKEQALRKGLTLWEWLNETVK